MCPSVTQRNSCITGKEEGVWGTRMLSEAWSFRTPVGSGELASHPPLQLKLHLLGALGTSLSRASPRCYSQIPLITEVLIFFWALVTTYNYYTCLLTSLLSFDYYSASSVSSGAYSAPSYSWSPQCVSQCGGHSSHSPRHTE